MQATGKLEVRARERAESSRTQLCRLSKRWRPGSAPLPHGLGVARPSSAARRRPVPSASIGTAEVAWGKGRPMMEPMGMLRQSSAPSLVPGGHAGFEPYQRLSKASYDVSRSPGMRRSASASNLSFTRPTAAPSMPQQPA
ncbi:unnamed protein product [Symbiodinium necroappetens]|uniref:Uncharacterized protein n=1 Tax=Symbiodinium necroappetens TaxID=1628268 RepID=A0A812PER4_9DINO|nr:unnamed protein product [Symbiodinium necroappetens]